MSQLSGPIPGWRVEEYDVTSLGVATLELVRPWLPIPGGAEDGESLEIIRPAHPRIAQMRAESARMKRVPAGRAWSVSYRGVVEPLESGGDGPNAPAEDPGFGPAPVNGKVEWSFRGSLRQVSIKANPNIADLKEKYGWDEARDAFPEERPEQEDDLRRGLRSGEGDDRASSLYGQTTFDDPAGTLFRTVIVDTVPPSAFSSINQIVEIPWPQLDAIPGFRNFKIGSPIIDPVGDLWTLVTPFELSGEGGWNPDVYRRAEE